MAKKPKPIRERGTVEELPSGSLRVTVYAGTDKATGKRNNLTETIPVPKDPTKKQVREAWQEAERVRRRLVSKVEERRHPRTKATVDELLDRYFELSPAQREVEPEHIRHEQNRARKHIRPLIGDVKIAELDAEVFDSFYGELQRCRRHCKRGQNRTDHRTERPHQCDERCTPHKCKPLGTSTVRSVHAILSGALKRAVRWKWLSVSPIAEADPPAPPPPDPNPPVPEELARIINAAWHDDPAWGLLIWMAARTGARRGEVAAWSLDRLDLDVGILKIETAIVVGPDRVEREKATKTHRKRRVALTDFDVQLLRAYLDWRRREAAKLGIVLSPTGRIFSLSPDHSTWIKPETLTQRFGRLCGRLGIDCTLKEMRHFAATELISAGVDVRTVAGLLGHGGGGTTTLRVYSAFVEEAAQRAVNLTAARMPQLPASAHRMLTEGHVPAIPEDPVEPYEHIARDLLGAIRAGILTPGDRLPAMAALAGRYHVAVSTIHRAIDLLKQHGLVEASRGVPAQVVAEADQRLELHAGAPL